MASKRWTRAMAMTITATCVLAAAGAGQAQIVSQSVSRFDISANYVATISNAQPGNCGCFAMNGGGTEEVFHLNRKIALAGDVSIVHTNNINGTGVSLGLATYLGGVRYSLRNRTRLLPYGQAMVGEVHGFDSTFPGTTSTTANAFAYDFGGGLEYAYSKRFAFRLVEASYLRTNLPNNVNGTQNNLKLAAGIVLHLR